MNIQLPTEAQKAELEIRYRMYVESYDHTIDDRPPLDFDTWAKNYGPMLIKDAIDSGYLTEDGQRGPNA